MSKAPKCKNCNHKPCYFENGKYYDFCGKTCATKYSQNVQVPIAPKCKAGCGKDCFFENGNYYDFCGKTCRNNHLQKSKVPKCKTGCGKDCFFENGKYYDFCGKTCKNSFSTSKSNDVSIISSSDKKYQDIENQFTSKWKKSGTPKVHVILKIHNSSTIESKFLNYQKKVDDEMKQKGHKNKSHFSGSGNTNRRFHGTKQECSLGLKNNTNCCSNSNCYVCGIIKNGFKIIVNPKKFERFGFGVYTTSTSGKSNDYFSGNGIGNYKSVFMCNVVCGKVLTLYNNQTDMDLSKVTSNGCHSVLGEVGQILNYDEMVVYREDAVIPKYLIIYEVK